MSHRESGSPGEVLPEPLKREWRRAFLEAANEELRRFQIEDSEGWADYQAESQSLEGALTDGLEDDPWVE